MSFRSIQENTSVTSLNLGYNMLTDVAAKAIADMLVVCFVADLTICAFQKCFFWFVWSRFNF